MAESRNLNRRLDAARKAAEQIAQTDALTGLQNRRAMTQYLDQLITSRVPFACMHMDLDYFKRINDTFGHAAGDYVLRVVAQVLNSETRAEDCVARIGGDEFVLIFVRLTDPVFLQRIAQRMITKLEEPVRLLYFCQCGHIHLNRLPDPRSRCHAFGRGSGALSQ